MIEFYTLFHFFHVSCILIVNFLNINMVWTWQCCLWSVTLHQCWTARFPWNKPFLFYNLFVFPVPIASCQYINNCMTLVLYFTQSCAQCFDITCWPTAVWKISWYGASQELQQIEKGRAKTYHISLKFNLHPNTPNTALQDPLLCPALRVTVSHIHVCSNVNILCETAIGWSEWVSQHIAVI